ncbi:MAG: FlgD immunoglobulin-like domain containing protein [Bacteroidota bacterium]
MDIRDGVNTLASATKTVTAYNSTGSGARLFGTEVTPFRIIPEEFGIAQNFPNPFNPETEIGFAMPEISTVKLTVLDVLGREILTLNDGQTNAGFHRVMWNGKNANGENVGSGVYFYRITAVGESGKQFSQTLKMLLAK